MSIMVGRVRTDKDWREGWALLAEQMRWVGEVVGFDIRTRQPTAVPEYADPATFYRHPDGALVIARADGRPAGVVGVHRLRGDVGELKRMYVRPWARGLGLGRLLVDAAVAEARELAFDDLWLETEPTAMAAALHIYRDTGFTDIEPFGTLGMDGLVTLGIRLDAFRVRAGTSPLR
jgi:GNAT superfamily N-acetyltransferase